MTSNDHELDAAIRAEEKALLLQLANEPGHFNQLGAIFTGRNAWVNLALLLAQGLLFVAGVFCAAHFFESTDAHAAILWGLPAAVLLLMALIIKLAMWPVIQTNRVLRAIKHLELQLAQSNA